MVSILIPRMVRTVAGPLRVFLDSTGTPSSDKICSMVTIAF